MIGWALLLRMEILHGLMYLRPRNYGIIEIYEVSQDSYMNQALFGAFALDPFWALCKEQSREAPPPASSGSAAGPPVSEPAALGWLLG